VLSCVEKSAQKNRIIVTIEPQRYFAEAIADTLFSIEAFVPSGVSPETYDPAPAQMISLANARVFFFVGGLGFETAWIDKLKENNPNVMFYRNDRNINIVKSAEEDACCHETEEHHHHHHDGDPHVWASPRNAITITENIYEALAETDPNNKEFYFENLQRISKKIRETDMQIKDILQNSTQKSFIIFHPSLTYFARDYGLTQHAIESNGKEPSPEQLQRLVTIARHEGIKTIFIQQEFDVRNAEIIAEETGCKLVQINPLSYKWHEEMLNIAHALEK
jgi:zinc transport system substrate-binding protein